MKRDFAFTPVQSVITVIIQSVKTPAVLNEIKMEQLNSQILITYLNHNEKRKLLK